MKKVFSLVLCVLWSSAFAAESDFLKNLRPDEARAAGLEKLSPEELARLEQLVQRFKSGVVVEVQEKADAKVRAVELATQQKIADAEARAAAEKAAAEKAVAAKTAAEARVAAAEKAPAQPAGPKRPGWFSALLTLQKAADKPEKAEPLESRLVGRFTGWNGHTRFNLEDGTRWKQQNTIDRYEYSPALESPKVKIVPAAFGGFWLRIEGVNMTVRVVPTDLPGADK